MIDGEERWLPNDGGVCRVYNVKGHSRAEVIIRIVSCSGVSWASNICEVLREFDDF